jgi:hypothetical protein
MTTKLISTIFLGAPTLEHSPLVSRTSKRMFLRGLVLATMAGAVGVSAFAKGTKSGVTTPLITVYKSAACSCCHLWVAYLEEEGFEVKSVDTDDLAPYKKKA